MEFLAQISIMVFLNLFSIYRLILMATMYTLNKDVKLGQFRIYEGEFPDRRRAARQLYQNMFELPILFYLIHKNLRSHNLLLIFRLFATNGNHISQQ